MPLSWCIFSNLRFWVQLLLKVTVIIHLKIELNKFIGFIFFPDLNLFLCSKANPPRKERSVLLTPFIANSACFLPSHKTRKTSAHIHNLMTANRSLNRLERDFIHQACKICLEKHKGHQRLHKNCYKKTFT